LEIRIRVLSFLRPLELVRMSRVSRSIYVTCFDGQLWKSLDMSELGRRASAEVLANIVAAAGPFARNINLRGCVQVENCRCADVLFKTCKNLNAATLEGCRNLRAASLNGLVTSNAGLASLDLTGLTTITNTTCKIIASSCPRLETLNISWCSHVTASGLADLVRTCSRLRDLRAAEVRGFGDVQTAQAIFNTNRLERLILSGCVDLSDDALKTMMHGIEPKLDILTDIPMVPTRRLRHLDLSRCSRLTNDGVRSMAHLVPDLEGLVLAGCDGIENVALEAIFASAPNLTFLDLSDMPGLTNPLFYDHLVESPCVKRLRHLSVSSCNLGDVGLLPVVKECTALESISLDNTRISNFVLAEAAAMVQQRAWRTTDPLAYPPRTTLHMTVYDCANVSAVGIRGVLSRNATLKRGGAGTRTTNATSGSGSGTTFPSEIVSLRCSYQHQQAVDEHTRRLLRGDFDAANRLEKKWAGHLQAMEEAASGHASARRRRRRAREVAATLLAAESNGGEAAAGSRPRARSAVSCIVM
jgi:F-box/leucine-rich repeat protein 2/20